MADNWTRNISCRYFRNGMCREGSNCVYRHALYTSNEMNVSEEEESSSDSSLAVECLFYKYGICRYGDMCHYRHSDEVVNHNSSHRATLEEALANLRTSPSPTSETSETSEASETTKEGALIAEEWVKAPEFVPSFEAGTSSSSNKASSTLAVTDKTSMPISYAQAVNPSGQASSPAVEPLCPYAEASGMCKRLNCTYLHGEICELCSRAALHPYNEELRKKHTNACVKQHEVDMEISFAIQRSREKSCGVCFEIIMEKSSGEQRFGILPNCNHCFCLTCIRKWRQAKQFDNKIIRACPECRVTSDFVCPSLYWVETKEEKDKLITDYKLALSTKDCKYFNKGLGKCPFGNKCFYLHALPDGTKTDVGPPVRHRRNADADIDILQQLILWDFFEERDDRWMYVDFEDLAPFFSDSEDSDLSEYELSFD